MYRLIISFVVSYDVVSEISVVRKRKKKKKLVALAILRLSVEYFSSELIMDNVSVDVFVRFSSSFYAVMYVSK